MPLKKIRKGEVWRCGEHRVVCGSALDRRSYEAALGGDVAQLVVTSPPYNQGLERFSSSGMQVKALSFTARCRRSYADSIPEPLYQEQQRRLLDLLLVYTSDDGSVFYNHKNRYRRRRVISPLSWILPSSWRLRQEVIWDRGGSVTLNSRMLMPVDERIYWLTKNDFVFFDTTELKRLGTVWRIAPRPESKVSMPFPLEIPLRAIRCTTHVGDTVLDPYGGSGTTLIAATRTGRRCVTIELRPRYCEAIVDRWERETGRTATRE